MKRIILASAAALAMLVGGQAIAQSVSIDLAPEHRTRIKEYVVKQKVSPYVARERVRVGATLPADVELREGPRRLGSAGEQVSLHLPRRSRPLRRSRQPPRHLRSRLIRRRPEKS